MKKELKAANFKPILDFSLIKKNYNFKVSILKFSPIKKTLFKRNFYLPTLVEVEYNPKDQTRRSFTLVGWASKVINRRIMFNSAKDTTSFAMKKRYLIRVPVVEDEITSRITFRLEVYSNIFTKKGDNKEVSYSLDLSKVK